MDNYIKKRVLEEAKYIVETQDTVRGAAKKFNVSKSTIHKDLATKLNKIDKNLDDEIKNIFKEHDMTKHIRGGYSTKEKYKRG